MIDALLRAIPLPAYAPLRRAILRLPRQHPLRIASTLVARRAARAYRHRLPGMLPEIRPLDYPALSFEPADSMVMDAVFWLGVRGYEGVVARVWRELCAQSRSVLEIGGNVGLFAVLGGQVAPGAYTVVEPVPAVAAILRANLARNGLARVEVLQAAVVAGAARNVVLSLPDEGRSMPVGSHLVDDVEEVAQRQDSARLTVSGLAIGALAAGRDLIKIDAEGIEAALLGDIRAMLRADRATLLIEVLPNATRLGALLAELAAEVGYRIHVLPEYGDDRIVTVAAADFTSEVPRRHRSKDVVLSVLALS